MVALCREHASDLENERYCWCSHAIEGQDLMWTGWREYRRAILECQPLSWLQKSARSRSYRGAHIRLWSDGRDQTCLLPQVSVPFWLGHAWHYPHFEPSVGLMHAKTSKNIVFILAHLWFFLLTFTLNFGTWIQVALCPNIQDLYLMCLSVVGKDTPPPL